MSNLERALNRLVLIAEITPAEKDFLIGAARTAHGFGLSGANEVERLFETSDSDESGLERFIYANGFRSLPEAFMESTIGE